ncbi:MAG: heavy-metal-associated domain-containing protein [Clostridium sp.]|uniref:heavy-metal-associated domain-containing protein n=1 Tax=Clostridium sp. TaxID=1506 RepID=UPI0030608BEF
MKKKILIQGMNCGHCVAHVEEALRELTGVTEFEVNLEGKYALVDTTASNEELTDAIDEAGYDVVGIEEQ